MISHKKDKLNNSVVIFILIAVWYGFGNFFWWLINAPVMPYSVSALHFLDIFKDGNLFYNAPLLTYIMRFMFFVFGKHNYDLIVIIVNYIFFLIPLYFIYKTALELKNKQTANTAMILFALVPAIYGLTRQYGHKDFHIIAAITFNIYCLIKTDYFKNLKWSVFYGVSIGLGLMIKDSFLAYFIAPFLYIAFIRIKNERKLSTLLNILLALLIGCLIAKWHYFRYQIILKVFYEPVTEPAPVFAFDSLRVMTVGLWEEVLSLPLFLTFVFALIWFIRKNKDEYKSVILLWFFVPWLIIMFMPHHKLSEYGAGFVPAIILISSMFLSNLKYKTKKTVMILIIAAGFAQYVDFSYGIDTKLFNAKFVYKDNVIRYYNKANNMIFYDRNKTAAAMEIVNYLYKNYPDSKIIFEDMPCSPPDTRVVLSQMALNDKICTAGNWFVDSDVLKYDVIVYIGKIRTIEEKEPGILLLYKYDDRQYQILHNYICGYLSERQKLINDNFKQIDEFYIDGRASQDYKITIYEKNKKQT